MDDVVIGRGILVMLEVTDIDSGDVNDVVGGVRATKKTEEGGEDEYQSVEVSWELHSHFKWGDVEIGNIISWDYINLRHKEKERTFISAFVRKDDCMKSVPLAVVLKSRQEKKDYKEALQRIIGLLPEPPKPPPEEPSLDDSLDVPVVIPDVFEMSPLMDSTPEDIASDDPASPPYPE
ncbi:Hypp2824 [Branchiostoma lanceolatum]|uniref:Hypp2824 protein n=1 Tax=Branchiostoma lanceolatum TaxID=7740 RepID=A0A8J9ZVC2_BRALA|nr:Hypp2824 [Branchiostoma lanceolatum]